MIQASLILENAESNSATIPVGIHSAINFVSVVQDGKWVDINFSNEERASIRKRLFEPTGTMLLEIKEDGVTRTETPKEALHREEMRNITIISCVLKAVLPEDEYNSFGGKDYKDFMTKAVSALNKYKSSKVNLKVVGKKVTNKETRKINVFSDIPNYPGFIEKYVENQQPTLRFSKKEEESGKLPEVKNNDIDI